jgi:hypothetical protein
MTVRLSRMARTAWNKALFDLMVEGSIALYSGPRPTPPGADPGPGNTVLIAWKLAGDCLTETTADGLRFADIKAATVEADGRPEWFVWRTKNGRPVMSGSVGFTKEADLVVDSDCYKGTEISMPIFRYLTPAAPADEEPADGPRPPRRLRIAT